MKPTPVTVFTLDEAHSQCSQRPMVLLISGTNPHIEHRLYGGGRGHSRNEKSEKHG